MTDSPKSTTKRSIRIAGRNTSVTLEKEFWDSFREIAVERGMSFGALVAAIDADRYQLFEFLCSSFIGISFAERLPGQLSGCPKNDGMLEA